MNTTRTSLSPSHRPTVPATVDPLAPYRAAAERNREARARAAERKASSALLALVVCFAAGFLAACAGGEAEPVACAETSDAAVLEVSNVTGACELPAKINLASLAADGCDVSHSASADACSFTYQIKCENVTITVEAFAAADDDVRGTLHKVGVDCSADADVRVMSPDPWK